MKKLARIEENIAAQLGIRFCTNCNHTQKAEGGKWIVYANGLRRRWKCGGCIRKELERKEAKNE
jgi:hypothetical protein